eukprot:CAMPEP_0115349000 /NCGR_PEP_ID=MMETSP0270-20121206/95693_1 /TAXON_ID=71861 /ORGANISM="Scrippsiella trochoidea, Strain CCMP3099" /LENGTH=57 /DNA_ID=CAMNT_0002770985 /DNA_START=14 /DNA_END=183 /DNA_ORIENTATION=-
MAVFRRAPRLPAFLLLASALLLLLGYAPSAFLAAPTEAPRPAARAASGALGAALGAA